ncbi:MAG: MFS transporter [Candidatus Eisenbacteria bacterium]|uniref:MFS transporter n=1 Tax=Eiseniibacteriota bacterium TaxID=2212470 RepID=A0A538T2J3_UNCEI|nr:MAG: MFS transporter [Candidatus Eisenbacteria bacterium]
MSLAILRGHLRSSFRALGHRNYRLYWTGQLVSLIGTWMQSVAQGWLMYRLTASAFMLGLLGFAQFLPVLLLTLWAGVIVDSMDKRRLLLLTQTAFLIQAALLATALSTGVVKPWMVLALAFVFGTINALDLPVRQSFVVELTGKEDLSNAIALNSAAFNTARVVGPAIAGILLATVGEAGCFWLNALSYVAVIASIWRMDLPARPSVRFAGRRAVETMMEGIRYARSVRPLRNLLTLLGVTAGLGFQYMILLPVYAREILHAGPKGYGGLVTAFGLGSLVSAAWMTRKLDRWALRRNLFIGLLSAAIGMGTFAWSRTLELSVAMGFLAGFGLILYIATTNTLIQVTTEDRFRGRVMSLYTLMFVGTAPIGALVSGTIAQHFSAPVATSFSALVLLGGALWMIRRLRVLAAREAVTATVPAATEKVG